LKGFDSLLKNSPLLVEEALKKTKWVLKSGSFGKELSAEKYWGLFPISTRACISNFMKFRAKNLKGFLWVFILFLKFLKNIQTIKEGNLQKRKSLIHKGGKRKCKSFCKKRNLPKG